MKDYIEKGDTVLDCTVGNGQDTLLLAQLVGEGGKVYGFDIQKDAIMNTRRLLLKNKLNTNVELFLDSHEYIDNYIYEKLDLIVYNLGYLPGGNKKITTLANTSIESINKALNLLIPNGILLITSYVGHTGSMKERNAIDNLLINLNQKHFNVLKYEFINQINYPPILYLIEKSKNNTSTIN